MIIKYKFIRVLFLVLMVMSLINITTVKAKEFDNDITMVRAGGGYSSGGGRGSSGTHGYGGRTYSCNYSNNLLCILRNIIVWIFIFCMTFFAAIVLYFKVLRASFNSKRYLRLLGKEDITWKYKNIEKQVIETFYIVQKCWSNMNTENAKEYMSKELYDTFKGKLEWMELGNKRNVLKRIKLINLKPISVYDDVDDSKDLVWFYIKGSMVDYIVDTKTHEKIEGNSLIGIPFVEFWKFTRNKDKWVLSKILQEDEIDKSLPK